MSSGRPSAVQAVVVGEDRKFTQRRQTLERRTIHRTRAGEDDCAGDHLSRTATHHFVGKSIGSFLPLKPLIGRADGASCDRRRRCLGAAATQALKSADRRRGVRCMLCCTRVREKAACTRVCAVWSPIQRTRLVSRQCMGIQRIHRIHPIHHTAAIHPIHHTSAFTPPLAAARSGRCRTATCFRCTTIHTAL